MALWWWFFQICFYVQTRTLGWWWWWWQLQIFVLMFKPELWGRWTNSFWRTRIFFRWVKRLKPPTRMGCNLLIHVVFCWGFTDPNLWTPNFLGHPNSDKISDFWELAFPPLGKVCCKCPAWHPEFLATVICKPKHQHQHPYMQVCILQ